jgi:hypothetical protein
VHNVAFDAGWQPKVTIGFPDDTSEEEKQSLSAMYDPPTQSFFIRSDIEVHVGKAVLEKADFTCEKPVDYAAGEGNDVVMMVDHELGHAYADQISRRCGLGQFPPPNYNTLPVEKFWGIYLISEGMGMWFESTSVHSRVPEFEDIFLPSSGSDPLWEMLGDRHSFYESALWALRPILDHGAAQGVEYLVRHPLVFDGGDFKAAVHAYRKEALAHFSQ